MEKGKLFICPTPIGNLEDITIRTIKTLEKVDIIAAEDTRHSLKLLNYYGIKKPITSYHEHNEREKSQELISKLLSGKNIAQISDAGMPGISDPGEILIQKAIENHIEVIALPGATALITALVVSGLSTRRFTFEGFLPSKKRERKERLKFLKTDLNTIIIYESPHRLVYCLKDMLEILGNRKIAIIRELTKIYEEIYRADIISSIEKFEKDTVRGEFVIVIEGGKKVDVKKNIDIEGELKKHIEEGYTKKDSIKMVVEKYNLPKNEVYKISLNIK